MLQTPTSLQGDVVIVTLDYRENGPVLERQHDLEMSLFKGVSDPSCMRPPLEIRIHLLILKILLTSWNNPKWLLLIIPISSRHFRV